MRAVNQHRHLGIAGGYLLAVLIAAAGCGGSGTFALSSEDNNPQRLQEAFALVKAPKAGTPKNATGKAMVFLATGANKKANKPKQLVAYDLVGKSESWRVLADVNSKVAVGNKFVAFRAGERHLIGLDVATGKQLWKKDIGKGFLGAAADSDRVFYVVISRSGSKPVWSLVALSGTSGTELWRADAPGQLGVPAARGGLVFSPFLKQWMAVLDAATGEQITRIRGIDEEISFVRATADNVFFGSKVGVFLLDERAASGRRAQSTYGTANLPKEFVRGHYHWDAFDVVQAGYSAYDRNRVLWRAAAEGDKLAFADSQVVAQSYRFFFAFDVVSGALRWAYSHPRVDVVGSTYLNGRIAFVSTMGEFSALESATGKLVYSAKLGAGERILGATFDADGWMPAESNADAQTTVAALAAIARDRDARFNTVKRFAIVALAQLPGGDVTRDLLALIRNERTPPNIYEKAAEVLVARREPAGMPHLLAGLEVHYDFITGTKPRAVGVVARAIAAMGDLELDGAMRGSAVDALMGHLLQPKTSASDLVEIIKALGAIGGGAELPPLRSFLLAYRADPAFSTQLGPVSAAIDVLLASGGAGERELVGFVVDDKRSQKRVAEYAAKALLQTARSQDGAESAEK
jgi:outer membrane protein assembly factor BamB